MSTEHRATIKDILEEIIQRIGFTATIEVTEQAGSPEGYFCAVKVTEGQNFLIGQYGMNLAALQHLIRVIARKQIGEKLDIIVDVNDYFSEKKELLEREAEQALEEALQNNISVALRPMLSYERKIVHAFLANNKNVITESVGEKEDRKVMVRPRPLESAE